jgi:hypothetical protein
MATASELPVIPEPQDAPPAIYQGDTYDGFTINIVDARFDWAEIGISEVRTQIRAASGAAIQVNKTLAYSINPQADNPNKLVIYYSLSKDDTSLLNAGNMVTDVEVSLVNGKRYTYYRSPILVKDQITRTDR